MIGVILIAVGVFVLIVGVYFALRGARLRKHGVAVDGTLVGYEVGSSGNAAKTYSAVVDYQTPDGETHRYTDNFPKGKKTWEAGATIPVLYDPEAPGRAMLATGSGHLTRPIVVMVVGVVALALGVAGVTDAVDLGI